MKYILATIGMLLSLSAGATPVIPPVTVTTVPGTSYPYGVFGQGYETMTLNYAGGSENVAAGAYTISIDGVTQNSVYCVDIFDDLALPGTYVFGGLTLSDPTKANQITALLANVKVVDAESSAAAQAAVWGIELQSGAGSYNITDPTRGFWVTNIDLTTLAYANADLTNVETGVWTVPLGDSVTELVSSPKGNQYLAFAVTGPVTGDITPIPEPFSATIFGSGLLCLGLVFRRREKRV